MKILRKAAIAFGILVLAIVCLILLLHSSFAKGKIARYLEGYAKDQYNLRLEIGSLNYDFFPVVNVQLNSIRLYGGKENKNVFVTARALNAEFPLSIIWSSDKKIHKLVLDTPDADVLNLPAPNLPEKKSQTSKGTFEIQQIVLQGGTVTYQGRRLQDVELQAKVEPTAIVLKQLNARYASAKLHVTGRLFEFEKSEYNLNYTIQADASLLKEFIPDAPKLSGELAGSGIAHGQIGVYQVEGKLSGNSITANGSTPFSINTTYKVDSSDAVSPYEIVAAWNKLPLSAFKELAPDLPPIAAKNSGKFNYSGPLNYWAGTGDIDLNFEGSGERGIPVNGILSAKLSDGRLNISKKTSLYVRSARLNLEGALHAAGMNTRVEAFVPSPSDFAFLSPQLRQLPGSYRISADVTGPYKNLDVNARINGSTGDSTLLAQGEYHLGTKTMNVKFSGDLSGALVDRYANSGIDGRIKLNGSAHGPVTQPAINADIQGQNLKAKGFDIGDLSATVATQGKVLNLSADIRDLSLAIAGSYQLQNKKFEIRADLQKASIQQFEPYLPASLKGTSGILTANLVAAGDADYWRNANVLVTVQEAQISRDQLQVTLDPGSNVQYQQQTVKVDLHGKFPEGPFDIQGTASLGRVERLNLHAAGDTDLKLVNLFAPDIQAQGRASFDMNLQGTISKPILSGRISSENFTILYPQKQLDFREGNLVADLNGTEVALNGKGVLNGGLLELHGTLPVDKSHEIALDVKGQNDLKILSRFTKDIVGDGAVAFDIHIGGTISKPDLSGKLSSQKLFIQYPARNLTLSEASLQAEFVGEQVSLQSEGLLNQAPLELQGKVSLQNQAGEIHLTLQSFSVASIASDSRVTGALDLKVDVRGQGMNPANWTGDVTLTPRNLKIENSEVVTAEAINVHLENGVALLEPVKIQAGQLLDLNASGRVDFNSGQVQGELKANTELGIISSLVPDVFAGGNLNADVRLSGSLTDPAFTGLLRVEKGAFRMSNYPIIVERVQLSAPVDKDRITIQSFSARVGGGDVQGGGTIDLKNWQPDQLNVWVKGQTIGMNYPEGLRSQLDTDLKLVTSTEGDYLLSGQIRILRSIYEDDIDYRDRLVNTLLSRKAELARQSTFSSKLKLDLDVQTIDDLRVRNNLARLRGSADLKVTGTLVQPRISGRVRIGEGSKVYFEGNEFEVNRGIIDFYGTRRIRPVVDVELFTVVTDLHSNQDYEITLPIRGPIDDLEEKDPVSIPDLATNQIYYLLITGRADAQFSEAGTQFAQRQLVGYFTGQLFFDVQRKLASAFGLSRIEIQPELISSEEDPGTRLIVGKDFTSQLSLIYSVSLNNSQERTWIANYRLKRNLSVRFIDQEGGSYTTNVRHSFRFGKGMARSKLLQARARQNQQPRLVIGNISIENHSPIPENEIRKKFGIEPGDEYDFWKIQDSLQKIEERLQGMGYLYPLAEFDEKRSNHNISVHIRISDNGLRDMVFQGYEITSAQMDKYKSWWREGFSQESVLELIRDDVLRSMWFQGFHTADVKKSIEITSNKTNYVLTINTGPKYPEGKLVFNGTTAYRANELEEDLKGLYDSKEEMISDALHNFDSLEDKITALYFQRGFLDTRAQPGRTIYETGSLAQKEILVQEGPQSRISEVVVSNGIQFPSDLRKRLKLWIGSIYDPQAAQEDELTISDYYEEHGYRNARLQSEFRRNGNAGLLLRYDLTLGGIARIAAIRITGNEQTRRSFIEKKIPFKPGDILNQGKLFEAQKNLSDLRIFHQVKVEPRETDVKDLYDVDIEVVEMKRYELAYGIRYDTETNLGGEVQVQDLNLFGRAHGVSLYTKIDSKNELFRAVYHSPVMDSILPGLRWKTLLSGSYAREELTPVEENGFPFLDKTWLFSLQRQREIWKPFTFLGGYQFKRIESSLLGAPQSFRPFTTLVSELLATVIADTRDDPLNARRGNLTSFEFEYAPRFLGSEAIFIKSFNQFFRFHPIKRMLWASGVRVGVANSLEGDLILSERFFAGGSYTVRGFRLDELGPRNVLGEPDGGEAVIIINQELRFPVYKWVNGVLFYDGGNVYSESGDFNPLKLRHSVGFGIRLDTPFGIGRFDLGVNLDPRISINPKFEEPRYVFHFGIGQSF